jgi:transposase-like protein
MAIMAKHYPVEQRERAVKMVLDHLDEYRSVYAACQAIGPKVGVSAESLRRWSLQAQVDGAQRPGATSAEQQRFTVHHTRFDCISMVSQSFVHKSVHKSGAVAATRAAAATTHRCLSRASRRINVSGQTRPLSSCLARQPQRRGLPALLVA